VIPIRILVVEDSEDDYRLLLRQLEQAGYAPTARRVDSATALTQALGELPPWDVIISDDNMPGFGGHQALAAVRKLGLETPFILMSGTIGEDKAVEAMRLGAQDYIMKSNSARLVPALARELAEREERSKARAVLREREEELRQAQKMEAIGQLAGGLAHDFNNILAVIGVHAEELLENPADAEEVRAVAHKIGEAYERARALVAKLMAFSRKQALVPREVDLNAILAGLEDMLGIALGKSHALSMDPGPSLPPIVADPVQIEQILMNLAVNARDAMVQGGRLRVRTWREDGPDAAGRVLLEIADSGPGMDPAVKARIFEPFFTTKEAGRGTGLGLSTVRGIVTQLGGEITVESEPGRGAIFRISFPEAPKRPISDVV
jgi:signal transduction histidine kinase